MESEIVIHKNTSEYIYSEKRNSLVVCLQATKDAISKIIVIYWNRTTPENVKEQEMLIIASDGELDYWQCKLSFTKVARYQKYYFKLIHSNGIVSYLTPTGNSKERMKEDCFEYLYTNPNDCIEVPKWSKGCIYYQIFPERFFDGDKNNNPKNVETWGSKPTRENYMGGDLKGIKLKIPYLQDLGVECLYMNPIFMADFNHKYATTDYYKVDPIFGTNEELGELVNECHRMGIKVVLDGVFNHTGIHFAPFRDAFKNGKESKYFDWFFFTTDTPSISHHDYECVGAYKYMPKLNTSNWEVQNYIIDIMDFWIREYHIDGWRLDVADEVDGMLWIKARQYLKENYPEILLLGETWGPGGNLLDGKKMDAVMNYCFRDAVRDYFAYECIDAETFSNRINRMIGSTRNVTNYVQYNLIDSHDTERFLFYCNGNKQKLRTACAFQMLFIGSPAIYYGDEIGMTGGNDPDCRACMTWDVGIDEELKNYYKALINLRKNDDAIRYGKFQVTYVDKEKKIVGFERIYKNKKVMVLIHSNDKNDSVCLNNHQSDRFYSIGEDGALTEKVLTEELVLSPYSVTIIKMEEK